MTKWGCNSKDYTNTVLLQPFKLLITLTYATVAEYTSLTMDEQTYSYLYDPSVQAFNQFLLKILLSIPNIKKLVFSHN